MGYIGGSGIRRLVVVLLYRASIDKYNSNTRLDGLPDSFINNFKSERETLASWLHLILFEEPNTLSMIPIAPFVGLVFLYLASLAIYRLYLSPIAKIPGPKIAGASWTSLPQRVLLPPILRTNHYIAQLANGIMIQFLAQTVTRDSIRSGSGSGINPLVNES